LTETVLHAGEWAAGVFGKVYDDIRATLSGQSAETGADENAEAYRKPDPRDDSPPETGYPSFRSLSELFGGPGSSREAPGGGEANGVEGRSAAGDGEASRPPDISKEDSESRELQAMLGLSSEELSRLNDMGFSSFEDIALLSSPDVQAIAERFDIPEDRIERVWISGAQLHLYEGP
jgi:hypothetical protein